MKLDITRVQVWAAGMKDKPGELAAKLNTLSQAGVNLDFVIARRSPEKKGTGVVFVTGISGAKELRAARKAGFRQTKSMHSLRVVATDKPGLGTTITQAVAEAGINLRGFSGAALGRKAVLNLAFDSAADAAKAQRCLKKL